MHGISQSANERARTVYVDADLVAVAYGKALLPDDPRTAFAHADLRDPAAVLRDAAPTGLLDLSRPIAVLMLAVLSFVPDADDPAGIVAEYRDPTVPGSFLVLSHGSRGGRLPPGRPADDPA